MQDEPNAYASPQTISQAPSIDTTAGRPVAVTHAYESGHPRVVRVMIVLTLVMLTDIAGIFSTSLVLDLIARVRSGMPITDADANANDLRQMCVGLLQMIVMIASAVVFLMWFHRVHRNLPALNNSRLKYTPGWAVGSWFVPFLNLFRPFQIMREVWQGSDPAAVQPESRLSGVRSSTGLVGCWWAMWLIMGFTSQIASRVSMHAETLGEIWVSSWADILCSIISIPAALLTIAMVRRVDSNQTERYRNLQGSSDTESPFQSWGLPEVSGQ